MTATRPTELRPARPPVRPALPPLSSIDPSDGIRDPLVSKWRAGASALFAIAPRAAYTYPVYLLSAVVLVDVRRTKLRSWIILTLLLASAGVGTAVAGRFGTLAPTALPLELALMLPLLLFVSGFAVVRDLASLTSVLRSITVILLLVNFYNIANRGIPYLDVLPDVQSGLYGTGGARIVTIFGFCAIVQELALRRAGLPWSRWILVIAIVDFLAPSYILAIICGLLALFISSIRSVRRVVAFAALAAPSLYYALFVRLQNKNDIATQVIGQNPKSYAYGSVLRVFRDHPLLMVFGTGPGQFSSTPQNLVDAGIRRISFQSAPNIPGLFVSSFHTDYLAPYTRLGLIYPYAISSSIDKPYTGVTSLLAEWGFVGLIIMALIVRRAWTQRHENPMIVTLLLFFFALNALDVWMDAPSFGLGLLVLSGLGPAMNRARTLQAEAAAAEAAKAEALAALTPEPPAAGAKATPPATWPPVVTGRRRAGFRR